MVQDAQIIVEKKSEVVPKDVDYIFPFSITAPYYGNNDITRRATITENELGGSKTFTLDVEKEKFNAISNIEMTKLDKYLILDGQYIRTIGDSTLDVVAVGFPTGSHFANSGFDDNIFVGKKETSLPMQFGGNVGKYKMFSIKIPDYFTNIGKIRI